MKTTQQEIVVERRQVEHFLRLVRAENLPYELACWFSVKGVLRFDLLRVDEHRPLIEPALWQILRKFRELELEPASSRRLTAQADFVADLKVAAAFVVALRLDFASLNL